jgi:NAD(P)H-hydrate epimerase
MGQAVKADMTITFIANKRGLYHGDAMDYTGETKLSTLNVPLAVYDQVTNEVERIEYEQFHTLLKPRRRNAHKGNFGHVLIIGGEYGLTGAPRMAGEAAARVGAGLVSIATRHAHAGIMNMSRPELMVHGVEDEASFHRLAERANVIAIGPGLGQSEWAQQLLNLAMDSGHPMVVDADALNVLSQSPQKRNKWVLTPHAGEAARLLGQSCAEIQEDRFTSVRELQETYGGIVVLKGAGTLVASTDLPVYLCAQGNPGMATGGMGDVLSGVIAGLIAQGIPLLDAATLGVCLHAAAGDGAAHVAGERGMIASDLMSWIRRLANPGK